VRRLRTLTEVECYCRCYGAGDGNVRIVRLPSKRRRIAGRVSGEELRRLFELRLDAREPELAA
jgi:hypothetical protein